MPGKIYSDRDPIGGLFAYPDQTFGHVNRDTSTERATTEADNGTATERALRILEALHHQTGGLTWNELGEQLGLHHGQVSGALSNLHKNGRVFMLRTKRGKSHPYVHNRYRNAYLDDERYDTPAQTRANKIRETEREIIDVLLAEYDRGFSLADDYLHTLIENLRTMKGNERA